ncbi:MAG: DivIVA domain-containing protein [Oscillospiraceae bacterium]|nr:DivIVA domain-containing protein [Oscillospiraceae bacterium]
MLTLNEIANVSFRKSNFAGYKPEDVDEFIDKVVESYDLLIKKNIEQKELNEQLAAENERLKSSLKTAQSAQSAAPAKQAPEDVKLSEECEYTQEEIKNALLSAQKLANATIREARQKAEALINDANAKAERIVDIAQSEVNDQKAELDRLKKLVSDFRASLLDSYKEHLKLVNALPTLRNNRVSTQQTAPKAPVEPSPKQAETPASAAKAQKDPVPETPKEPESKAKETDEELSHTKSFQIGKQKDETGEFSELKFGADYDIRKG